MKRFLPKFVVAFVVAICLIFPTSAFAYIPETDDQSDPTEEEIAEAIASGMFDSPEVISASSDDSAGVSMLAIGDYAFTTIAGATRYDTSASEALAAYPSGASTVIISGGEKYADSIAGSSLAGAIDAPILLTTPGSLGDVTTSTIKTLGASNAIILGGTEAVSATVENQLIQMFGSDNVTRLSGPTRYDTQMAIYNYGVTNGFWTGDTAIVATGKDFPDALSISPIAFSLKAPIFFMNENNSLPEAQLSALKSSGKTNFLLIGGSTVAPDSVLAQLRGIGTATRLGGGDRYSTAKAVNDYAVANYGFTWDYVAFSSATSPWDSLGGGVMQGKNKRVLCLLNNGGSKAEPQVLAGSFSHAIYLGGKNIYSNAFKAQVAYKLGFKVTDIKGFKIYIDAGHGKSGGIWDSGATGCGYHEADLTQELVQKVASIISSKYGIEVCLHGDVNYRYRQAEASSLDCGLFFSVHFNAGGGRGTESYIHNINAAYGSKHIQSLITQNVANLIGRGNRGEKRERFAVCSGDIPACLLEVCFIDNSGDMSSYQSHKDAIAESLASALANF